MKAVLGQLRHELADDVANVAWHIGPDAFERRCIVKLMLVEFLNQRA